jgi:tape measure domain-containing protein
MPFGSLSAEQRAVVLLQLKGAAQYATQMGRAALQTGRLALATGKTGFAMQNAAKKTWLMNQATFTLRRYTFYATLALTTAAAAAIKLGVSYLSSMQTARVALRPVFNDQQALNNELRQLFILGKYSPFVLADMTTAFRVMYPALHTAGLGVDYMNKVLKAMVDALSFAGKTSPAALNRVSYALQHMLFQGRLTGRVVQQLGQLGVPVMPILNRYLGITADQLHNIAALNISPQSFLNAFVNFVNTTPGYRGAALRLSLQSFHGLLQVTRDSLSQIIGVLLRPAFAGGQSWLFNIAKPGGPLDRLSNISTAGGFSAVIMSLSRMLTGNGMAGRGILLFTDTLHNLWRIFYYRGHSRICYSSW